MDAYFNYKGGRVCYQLSGKGRAIVLIHGFLGDKEVWKYYHSSLSKSFKTISIDLPGHGKSESFGFVHQMEYLAELLKSLLNHLKIRKCVIVGHSLGGYVALALAEQYPDSILGLILINSTAKGDSKKKVASRNQLIKLVKMNKDKALKLLVPSFFSAKTKWKTQLVNSYLKKALSCDKKGVIASIEGMKIRKEREIVLKFAPYSYLIMAGELDEIFSIEELKSQANLNDNGYFIELKKASHMAILEAKEEILKQIKTFSKKLSL